MAQYAELLKPRFVIAAISLVLTTLLMMTGDIPTSLGTSIIIGVLVAFGAYHADSPKRKRNQ